MEVRGYVQAELVKKVVFELMIMQYFIEAWKLNVGKMYNHIDVTLSKRDVNCYYIRVTNYERCVFEVVKFLNCISDCRVCSLSGSQRRLLGVICYKISDKEPDNEYELVFKKAGFSVNKRDNHTGNVKFPSWKEYLSIELQCKLSMQDADQFNEIVLSEIASLRLENPNVKFTYYIDEKLIHNNHIRLDDDYKSCKVLSGALSNIIKQSLNNEFRDRCFQLLNVSNSYQAENSLVMKLLPMINENYNFPHSEEEPTTSNSTDEK